MNNIDKAFIQERFDKTITLLEINKDKNEIAAEFVNIYKDTEIRFYDSHFRQEKNKDHLFGIYSIRERYEQKGERKENPFVIGYDYLMPRFKNAAFDSITIIDLTTEKGSYLVFCDYEITEFLGVLKSKRTLSEIKAVNEYNKKAHGTTDNSSTFLNGIIV